MPPKPKFTKEEIAAAALAIIREESVEALTARSLGAKLGTSARPIFTVFKSMDEVKWAARALALREFEAYTGDFTAYTPAFKKIGMQMVSYAIHEPEVFKLLFMQEHKEGRCFANTIEDLGGMADICISLIRRDYALTPEEAETLFEQMWVHTFGLGVLCATRVCDFSEEQIANMLGQMFAGMLMVLKSGKKDACAIQPQKDFVGKVGDLPYLRDWCTEKKREEEI